MIFRGTTVAGAWVIDRHRLADQREFFARIWGGERFAERGGLSLRLAQWGIAHAKRRGTLRGLRYQLAPHEESKLVRCFAGAIYDAVMDLRPASPSFRGWCAVELSAENRLALYVSQGCARGYLALADDSEVLYRIAGTRQPDAARGVRSNGAAFGIRWSEPVLVMDGRDRALTDLALPVAVCAS